MSGRPKNHTLKGGTSPYSLCMGVPPPLGPLHTVPSKAAARSVETEIRNGSETENLVICEWKTRQLTCMISLVLTRSIRCMSYGQEKD